MSSETLWYFAIGAMINPISCAARNVVPQESRPAELLDHSLYFFGSIGIGEALPDPGASFHGVAHLVDRETMERLDKIERDYIRILATAKFYNGTTVQVQVYSRSQDIERSPAIDKPPGERYVEIIVAGCLHYGVKQEYIDAIKSLDCVRRPTPNEFLTHGTVSDGMPNLTRGDIAEFINNQDRIILTIHSKVFELVMDDTTGKTLNEMTGFTKSMGFEGEISLSKIVYDPKYGIVNSLDECTREHSAYQEDVFVRYITSTNMIDNWKLIGSYADQSYKEDEEELLWYFAIGSMTHPMSCKGRNITPKESKPAVLIDYRLYFFGSSGVAEAVPAPGNSFHGVAHLLDKTSMERLDSFEIGYIRVPGTAITYDGTELAVQCYSRPAGTERSPKFDKYPTERYLDVIRTGCEYHGVQREHIEFLRRHEKQARPKPHQFLSLGKTNDDMPCMTRTDIRECTENRERIMVTVNGKVFELFCHNKESLVWKVMSNGPFQSLGSFESEIVLSQVLFDPFYGVCLSLEDVSREHSAYIEDMHARFSFIQGRPSPWKVIATYADQKYKD